jgi:hypothetical protein
LVELHQQLVVQVVPLQMLPPYSCETKDQRVASFMLL